jgi:glutaredoxin
MADDSSSPGNAPAPRIDLYWRPGCGFCSMLQRKLDKLGIERVEHNIWDDPADAEIVRAHARGNETVPTVVIGDRGFVNPSDWRTRRLPLDRRTPNCCPRDSSRPSRASRAASPARCSGEQCSDERWPPVSRSLRSGYCLAHDRSRRRPSTLRHRDRRLGDRHHRQHAADPTEAAQRARRHRLRVRDEERGDESRWFGQGPPGPGDDPRRRTRGPAAAGRHDRRADQRQHRRRTRHRRRPARLPLRVRDDRQGRSREGLPAARLRRRGGRVPRRRRTRRPTELLQRRGTAHPRTRRVPAQPVPEPAQSRIAREDHGPRDLASDRWPHHPLHRRCRNVRVDHRRRPLPEVDEPRHQDHRGRPGGLGVLRGLRPALPGRGCG